MKIRTLCLASVFGVSATAPAAVTLTFDSDLEGFTAQDATTVAHSAVNGGSMQISSGGGWAGNSVQLSMNSNAELWAEFQAAETRGGTISYQFFVRNSEQSYTGTPFWFETVLISNSPTGWDQNIVNHGIGGGNWPLDPDEQMFSATLDIVGGAAAENDSIFVADTSGGWTNLNFGLNNDPFDEAADPPDAQGFNQAADSVTIYVDNFTVSANPIPEPGSALLAAVAAGALALRRRRR